MSNGSDGQIRIDTKIEQNNVNAELRQLQREISNMSNELKLANTKALMPFQKQMFEVEKKFHTLGASMGSFTGTNQEFMNQVQQLGAEYKKASDNILKADTMARMSLIRTAGTMMNMNTQASKISEAYKSMGNPLYSVNRAGLAVADSLNQIANRGNAAVLALKQLGPNANMKQLQDRVNMINQGIMRFQAVALAAAVSSVLLYGALHKANMAMNPQYAAAYTNMINSLKKAFEPMVQVFASVLIPIYQFITAIANLIIKFNEAHPVIAKILQAILMLIPALTLLLSPLAIGIGLWAGLQAAWASVWAMIGPLITGLAAISATVWIVAAAIVALVAVFIYLWNTNEGFRNAVIAGWQAIQAAAIATWNFILNGVLIPIWTALVAFGQQLFGQLKDFWQENGDNIMQIAQVIWDFVRTYVIAQITALVATAKVVFEILKSVVQAVWGNIKSIISGAVDVILGIIGVFVSVLTGDWEGAWDNVQRILKGAWEMMKGAATLGVNALLGVIRGIGNALGGIFADIGQSFYNAGKGFIDMLVSGIESMVGKVADTIGKVAGMIRDHLPFSPAKVGPLSDLDKLDFGGPITDSIKAATPLVQHKMEGMLSMPTLATGAVGGTGTNVTNHTPISVQLNYSGNANQSDLLAMVDFLESELERRFSNRMFIMGVNP